MGDVTSITEPRLELRCSGGAARDRAQGLGSGYATETIAYDDPYGVPTVITDFDGNTTTFTLDSHGNVLEEDAARRRGPGVDVQRGRPGPDLYGANGATTSYTYDSLGRLTTITDPGTGTPPSSTATTRPATSPASPTRWATPRRSPTTRPAASSPSRTRSRPRPARTPSFTYDADGNLLTVTDALGNTTSYTYNARDEVVEHDRRRWIASRRYGYDADGNVTP